MHKIYAAIDCGLAVNPALVKSQVEGSIAFALSTVLSNGIVLVDGEVQQSNFHDYIPTRHSTMPDVEVLIRNTGTKPFGVGEGAVALVAPSLGNAIFAATGQRMSALPFNLSLS